MKTLGKFVNATAQAATDGNPITFNTTKYCPKYFDYAANGTITFKKTGTYMIFANFTTTATATGGQVIYTYENNVEVPGASGE